MMGASGAGESKDRKPEGRLRLARPTRKMVRAHCADCLCLAVNQCYGFDCGVETCSLYPAMPWRGRSMPGRLRGVEV